MDATKKARAFVEQAAADAVRWREQVRLPRSSSSREDAELQDRAARTLASAGIDLPAFERLAAEGTALRQKLAEQDRHAAREHSPVVARMLASRTPLPAALDPESYIVIDEVTFSRTFNPGDTLVDSRIAPLDNWVRYRYETDGSVPDNERLPGRLGFFTLWTNDSNRPAVISAGVHLQVHGHFSATSSGSGIGTLFGINSTARATVRARTTVHVMGEPSLKAVVADRELAEISAHGGFFEDYSSTTIVFSEYLAAFPFTVPKRETILIELELLTEDNGGGNIKLDAESGAYRIAVPHLMLIRG